MNKALKLNIISYYFSSFFVALAYSLPHSILTILLLEKGVSIAQIALIQSAYSLAILLFELPSGIWADLYSRKMLYILSNLVLAFSFLLILLFDNFFILVLAWFIYGFSSALSSGTLDAQIINDIKDFNAQNEQGFIAKFVKYTSQISLISVIFGSLLGSFLYFKIGANIYILGIAFLFCSLICVSFFKENREFKKARLKKHILASLAELRKSKALRLIFALAINSSIFFQTHFQLWQAYFLEKGFSEKNFYLLYLFFQLSSIILLQFTSTKAIKALSFVKFTLLCLLFLPILLLQNLYIVVFAYIFYTLLFIYLEYKMNCLFANLVSKQRISALSSAKSSFSRLCAFLIMLVSSVFLHFFSVSSVVFFNFLFSMILMLFLVFKFDKYLKN